MSSIYVVWDVSESFGGEREEAADEEELEKRVAIRDDSKDACDLAVTEYKQRSVNQMVVEITPDGGKKIISFVGELKGSWLNSYGEVYDSMINEMRRAVVAGLVLIMRRMRREED